MKKYILTLLVSLLFSINLMYSQKATHSIMFSSLYGTKGTDDADVVTVDKDGNIYLGCHSNAEGLHGSTQYPYDISGGMDAFVVKLNNTSKEVEYITKLGGSKWEAIQGVVADDLGNIYAIGTTYSSDFPIDPNGFQSKFGGKSDAFVIKINPKGEVIWSTFLGGKEDEDGRDIVLANNGNIHVIGRTASMDFPVSDDALQSKSAGGIDAFVATLDAKGKVLKSTYLGGSGDDVGFSIKVDTSGQLYIAGTTSSQDFPVKNAIQPENKGRDDAFFAIIDKEYSSIKFSSYMGGKASERLYSIDLDSSGDIFIMGFTNSSDYPITKNAFQSKRGGDMDVFVTRFNLKKRKLIYSTFLGGGKKDKPKNLVVNEKGYAFVVGLTNSHNYPVTTLHNNKIKGAVDAFITVLDPNGSSLYFSDLFGGDGDDFFEGIALGKDASVIVSGGSNSNDFPMVNPIQNTFLGGRFDMLVTCLKIK